MKTERLYYSDCYLADFDAHSVDLSAGGRRVYLDRTAFYPASGGQPYDLGTLGGQSVLEVVDEEERIAHIMAAPLQPGPLRGSVLWPRRYGHMQQHTGQHLLSAVFVELFGFATLSFHMGEDVSTVELAAKDLTDKQVEQAEARAQEMGRAALPVQIGFADAATVEGLRKRTDRTGPIRIVEIPGVDKSACGGTHVRTTAETLPIQIRKLEKVRGNVRLEFVCGERASARARQDFRLLQELAQNTATPFDKLAGRVADLQTRLTESEKDLLRLVQERARGEGREAYLAQPPAADGSRRARWDVEQVNETVRARCLAFAEGARSVVLAVGSQPPGVLLLACSADLGLDAGGLLKQTISECGAGRGGGSASLAQGTLPSPECVQRLAGKLGMQ